MLRLSPTEQHALVSPGVLPLLIVCGVCAGLPMTIPLPSVGAKDHDRACARRVQRPSPSPFRSGHCRSSPATQRRTNGSKEHLMITETQTRVIVLQLTDELIAQLRPFMAGLDITATAHGEGAYQKVEHHQQRLSMSSEVYEMLAERVGGALDYEVRWQPNEYEPDGFVEHVRPLELTNGILAPAGCPQCGAQILANGAEVACACGQVVSLI